MICPPGANCSHQQMTLSTLRMKDNGYWEAPWGKKPSYHKCIRPENCQANFGNSNSTLCFGNTHGPLCAVCLPNHFIENGHCKVCGAGFLYWQLAILGAIVLVVSFLLYMFKRRAKQLYRKFKGDILRILTINLGFAQINSSILSVISVPFPESYVQYVQSWNFVNFDFTELLGLSCIGGEFDYRARVGVACSVPFIVGIVWGFLYIVRRSHAKHGKRMNNKLLLQESERIFLLGDNDETGSLDEDEFAQLLKLVGCNGDDATETMRVLGAKMNASKRFVLSQESFSKAMCGDFAGSETATRMIEWSRLIRARSSSLSEALQLLFLLHAPVSQRIFHYFLCHDIAGRKFLISDYSLSCEESKYVSFLPSVIFMLVVFSLGFPFYIFVLLWRDRKKLQTPSTLATLGFLYSNFKPRNGEYWEVHELFRKLILMGGLVRLLLTMISFCFFLSSCTHTSSSLLFFIFVHSVFN